MSNRIRPLPVRPVRSAWHPAGPEHLTQRHAADGHERLEDFDKLYATQGYQPMSSVDLSNDPNMEKVVVYGLKPKSGTGAIEVTHGALMDEQGRLASKIGTQPLIRPPGSRCR